MVDVLHGNVYSLVSSSFFFRFHSYTRWISIALRLRNLYGILSTLRTIIMRCLLVQKNKKFNDFSYAIRVNTNWFLSYKLNHSFFVVAYRLPVVLHQIQLELMLLRILFHIVRMMVNKIVDNYLVNRNL